MLIDPVDHPLASHLRLLPPMSRDEEVSGERSVQRVRQLQGLDLVLGLAVRFHPRLERAPVPSAARAEEILEARRDQFGSFTLSLELLEALLDTLVELEL